MNEEDVLLSNINTYFRTYDNADQMTCGCGCKRLIDVCYGINAAIEADIVHIIKWHFKNKAETKKGDG